METLTTSHEKSGLTRDHIILYLGEDYHISIVEERDSYYHRKELALMRYESAPSLLGGGSLSCVRLCEWYDTSIDEVERTLSLIHTRETEASIVATAITRANNFISNTNTGDN
jgi:hypothetical protein